ncbi:MAG TPA: phosphodiester glycosidase family protein [Polyangia bacterium]
MPPQKACGCWRTSLSLLTQLSLAVVLPPSLAAAESVSGNEPRIEWKQLQPGLEFAVLALEPSAPDKPLTVVRIDPARARLRALVAAEQDGRERSAPNWCEREKLAAAINLGMFRLDHRTNVGYLRTGKHINNHKWASKYQSVLAFDPRRAGLPSAIMVDLDEPGAKQRLEDYDTVIQNLRLIKSPGQSAWHKKDRKWSEAAVASDRDGHILFLFSRTPFAMADFNRMLLALPLHIERAMHVEGGPEASLSIHAGGVHTDLFGSYETGFLEQDSNGRAWPIPNVIGVEAVPAP